MTIIKRAFRYLRRRGVADTISKTGLHFQRKREERQYLQRTRLTEEQLTQQRQTAFSCPLRFSIVVPLYNTPEDLLREMIESVQKQTYGDWELCLADGSDAVHEYVGAFCNRLGAEDSRIRYQKLEKNEGISGNSNACLAMTEGDYIALLDHDDLLMPSALFEMRSAIEKTGADFLYSDEAIFRSPRRDRVIGIRMKPSFSPDSLLSNNYICHLTVFSRELLAKAGGFRSRYDGSQDHDLILRLTNCAKGIAHISKVLYLWRSVPTSVASDINSKRYAIEAGRSAVKDFLREQRSIEAQVESVEVFPTMYRVRYPIEGRPAVRVIVDATRERDISQEKIRLLQESSGWSNCVWTLLVNQDGASVTFSLPTVEWINISGQEGSSAGRASRWARAAEKAEEDYLLFLDGIPEALEEGWVREMLSLAQQPHIGAVGPKILLEDGDVRHAGVILGMGLGKIAGRLYFRGDGESEDAFFGQLAVVEDVSAVTDCLMVSREKYEQAGGFADCYADALFEADFCLRLLERGYYNVYTPHARLQMGQAKDVRFDVGGEYASYARDAEAFRQRNPKMLERGDAYYNANLSREYENWRIRV